MVVDFVYINGIAIQDLIFARVPVCWRCLCFLMESLSNENDTTAIGLRCAPLGWSGSGSVIGDHSDHCRSNEPMNPCPEWIHRFIWSTMIRVISDHWSWSGSSQRNAPLSWQNSNSASASHIFVHFFDVTAPLRLETTNFTYCGGREHKTTTSFFFSWTSLHSFRIQLQKKLPAFARIERDEISAMKFEEARLHFDVTFS